MQTSGKKNFNTFLILILLSYSSLNFLQAQDKYIEISKEIVNSALKEENGYEWLDELCKFGPRLSGSENSMKAIRWAEEKMKELGFEVWLQPVMVPHWVRGEKEKAVIVESDFFKERELEILALGRSVGTDEDGITAEVIEIKNFDELVKKQKEVKNKIVFFSRPLNPGTLNTFQGYGDAVDQRSKGAIEAAKYGAVAVLIRSITTKRDNIPHTGSMNEYVDSLPKIPAASLGYLDADFLSEALIKDPSLKINIKLNCKTLPDILSYNVICDLKGSEHPDEIIVVAGHFDSWDAGCGAHDDGGGCIQSLEVLDLFKRLSIKPKRTIRCIFYINEENGVKGGIEYGNYADTSKEKHIAAIESDRGVYTPVGFTVTSDSLTLLKLQSWNTILENAGIEWIKPGGSGVDISKIKNAKALIGFVPDDQRYFDLHHSANDVFEEVHPREMELGSAAIAILAYLLSEEL
ncbi:MAG TPA: M20/M25/M40 family metallo-hydrolase [Ignavibacteriaceae bacterium]|nr:M20/M25/M40 family metallo-hydrolase [Ignavibacteriaceae bacterium]